PYETLLANEVAPFPVKEIGLRLENLDSLRLFRFSPILTQSSFVSNLFFVSFVNPNSTQRFRIAGG
ncbi:MAG: hypothetical protein J6N53_13495, partial [Lachnospiraceae bacterium]|nr:hypothetical protein [Lachnospiraceae bacterium]